MWSRTAICSLAIGSAYVALVVVGPFCAMPILDLFAIPICLLAEYLLIAGFAGRMCESARPSLFIAAAAGLLVGVHVLASLHVLGWAWTNPICWIVAPMVVVGFATLRLQPPRVPLLLMVAGVVLAMVALGLGLDVTSSVLLAVSRVAPPPVTWAQDLSIAIGVTAVALVCSMMGLARRLRFWSAVRLTVLIGSIPVVTNACLALFVWTIHLPLSD